MAASDSRKTRVRHNRNLVGFRSGRLVAVQEVERKTVVNRHWKARRFLCRCDCGNTCEVDASRLTSYRTQSCGCLQIDCVTKHGACKNYQETQTFSVWRGLVQRCTNPSDKAYPRYGGRGITVCDRWRDSFAAFLADMGESPAGLTIDRIDNDGNYEPGNCRWATARQQANNKGNNIVLLFNGRSQTLMQWSNELGIKYSTIQMRLNRGWTVEQSLSISSVGRERKVAGD